MNENINLCEILKGHEGETFYSPTFGKLALFAINFQTLEFTSIENDTVAIDSSGKFYDKAGEICVFPSKDQRDWNKWVEEQKPKVPKTWSDIKDLINDSTITVEHLSAALPIVQDDKVVKSALALLKIHQLIEAGYGGNVTADEWHDEIDIYYIHPGIHDKFYVDFTNLYGNVKHIAFHTKEQAEEFLNYPENIELLKDYFMI